MLTDLFGLTGKTAIVTGGSKGLGFNFAKVLAAAGAQVAIIARDPADLESATQELSIYGRKILPLSADVGEKEAVAAAIRNVVEGLGHIDVLVNAAGNSISADTFDYSADDWNQVLATNLRGTWLMCQAVLKSMVAGGKGGSIINISSVLARRSANGSDHAYPCSKAAVEQLTRSLATEFADRNIRVNAIAPGWIPTTLNEAFLSSPVGKEFIAARVPMARTGEARDLNGVLLLLASSASAYMTGSVIPVDGGLATANI